MRAFGVVAGIVAMLTVSSPSVIFGASRSDGAAAHIVADVEGHRIQPASISSFYCHDFDYPRIHCFRSAWGLRGSERKIAAALAVDPRFGVGDYVTIFDGPNYSGSFMDVSQNYDALFSIGWNDRISSFKARNSALGVFWTDWFRSGTGLNFCCNQNVSSLPSSVDNAFSSVYRR